MHPSIETILRCPACAASGKGLLEKTDDGRFVCEDCGRSYGFENGLPRMLTPEGDFLGLLERKGTGDGRD